MLADIFDGLQAEFEKLMPGVDWRNGGENLGGNGAPPRVVWVPKNDSFQAGEIHYPDATTTSTTPRPLAQAESTVELHLWGEDWTQAEAMRDAVVNAMRASAGAAYRLVGGEWVQQGSEALTQKGRVYVLTISFLVPILETAGGIATVTATIQDVNTTSVP